MSNVNRPAFRRFDVIVTLVEGLWTAACDALHLATEAETFEALTVVTRFTANAVLKQAGVACRV